MPVTINGTTGIAGVDGSASTPAVQGTDTNTGIFFPAADTIAFGEGGTEAMRIDSSGNVGINTTSPASKLDISTGGSTGTTDMITLSGLDSGSAKQTYGVIRMGIENNTASSEQGNIVLQTVESGTVRDRININGSGYISFINGGTERARIDSSGNFLIGKTAPDNSERLGVKSSGNTSSTYGVRVDNSSATAIFMIRDDGYLRAPTTYNLTGGTANLSIDSNGFITRSTSSLRYKRDIENYNKGLNSVAGLRPVFYKSSVADASGTVPDTQFAGLIAEELHEAGFSEFVEYNEQGQPDAVRYGNMVALAFKAIQELKAITDAQTIRIETLEAQNVAFEARLAALEAK